MDRNYLLRIANYEYFLSIYTNTGGYYKTAHQILADLEKKVCFNTDFDDMVFVEYKLDGDCIFNFDRISHDGNDTYIVYNFNGTIS